MYKNTFVFHLFLGATIASGLSALVSAIAYDWELASALATGCCAWLILTVQQFKKGKVNAG